MKFSVVLLLDLILIAVIATLHMPLLFPDAAHIAANDLVLHVVRIPFAATGQHLWSDRMSNGYPAFVFYPPLSHHLATALYPFMSASAALGVTFIIMTIAQIALIYMILRRLKGLEKEKSILVALLWAANPFFLHQFLQPARFGELSSWTFAIAFLYFFIRYRETSKTKYVAYSALMLSLTLFSHYLPFMMVSVMVGLHAIFSLLRRDYRKSLHFIIMPITAICISAVWFLTMLYYMDYSPAVGRFIASLASGGGVVITPVFVLIITTLFMLLVGKRMWKDDMPTVIYIFLLVPLSLLAAFNLISIAFSNSIHILIYTMCTFVVLMLTVNSPYILKNERHFKKFLYIILVSTLLFYGIGVPFVSEISDFVSVPFQPIDDKQDIENVLSHIEADKRFLVYGDYATQTIAGSMGSTKYGLRQSDWGMGYHFVPPYLIERLYVPDYFPDIDEKCSFLGTSYVITDNPAAAEELRGFGYEEVTGSGRILLFRTPYKIFPDDLELVSYSLKRIHVRALSDGTHTIKITLFSAWGASDSDGNAIPLESDDGYMSFSADAGEDVILEFRNPPVFYAGLVISAVSLLLVMAVLIRSKDSG